MNLDYASRIIEDSLSPLGYRLTTFEITFPRFLLAEFNTHRVLSRNSASSRAIPPEKQIERLLASPFVPEFGTRVKGMGSGVVNPHQMQCGSAWLWARDAAVHAARELIKLDADKSRINRLLEPFMWHTVIVSGTRWSNFFGLRTDKDAQPEFRIIAQMMQDEFEARTPRQLEEGEWHLPMVTAEERTLFNELADWVSPDPSFWTQPMLSAGRTARVSFDTHANYEAPSASIDRAVALTKNAHWSPTEHQAQVYRQADNYQSGNFHGDWWQFRKMFRDEEDWNNLKRSGATR